MNSKSETWDIINSQRVDLIYSELNSFKKELYNLKKDIENQNADIIDIKKNIIEINNLLKENRELYMNAFKNEYNKIHELYKNVNDPSHFARMQNSAWRQSLVYPYIFPKLFNNSENSTSET